MNMQRPANRYLLAALCVLLFLLGQMFQQVAYRFWIPSPDDPASALLVYLKRADQLRAIILIFSILILLIPYIVVAQRFRQVAPLTSAVGLIGGIAFIGFELTARSIDLFLVGQQWAHQFQAAAVPSAREIILQRFQLWNDFVHAWYFPLLLSHFVSSCGFCLATWNSEGWYRLGPIAFLLNGLRLIGRILSMFAGQRWLESLNNNTYFPAVLVVNLMLTVWFLLLAKEQRAGLKEHPASVRRPFPSVT
jgi:hypothetical protein